MGCSFTEPFDHSPPVHHGGIQKLWYEWLDECLWAQLQYERWQQDRNPDNYTNTLYLDNLENEWARRGICSRCHREIGPELDSQVSELERRANNAEEKIGRLRRVIAVTSDSNLRPQLMSILDDQ